jgi:hypothetical protein
MMDLSAVDSMDTQEVGSSVNPFFISSFLCNNAMHAQSSSIVELHAYWKEQEFVFATNFCLYRKFLKFALETT